ncbi:hypothetical protein A2W24_01260 [Microgenomates group bacterium RBG_16_45_19]|nr:MAG: hypothetical protein A2W24_01260 [Microgenomates group bacterium RBG_16_45_19]
MDLQYDPQRLAKICDENQAEFLGVFGSYARNEADKESDLDLLVRFAPENKGGLFQMAAMRDDLGKVFNKKVDLLTEGFLSRYFRDEVLRETKPLYEKTE